LSSKDLAKSGQSLARLLSWT